MSIQSAVLLAVLGWSLADGRNVSVCELRDELGSAIGNRMGKAVLTQPHADFFMDSLTVKIVCHADTVSKLNTCAETPQNRVGTDSPAPPGQNCTLFGLFQLSSCEFCSDGVTPTADACGMLCSKLLDDDIQDDISCLLNIPPGLSVKEALWKLLEIIRTIAEDYCARAQASDYFRDCY